MERSPSTSPNMAPLPRSASSPYALPASHENALDALDDLIAETENELNFVDSNVYSTLPRISSPPNPNNPRQLDMHPELATYLQGDGNSTGTMYRSPSRPAVSPRGGQPQQYTPEPQSGYTLTPTARLPSPRGGGGSQVYTSPPPNINNSLRATSPTQTYTSPTARVVSQQYTSPPALSSSGSMRASRGSQQYTSPPNINLSMTQREAAAMALRQAELQKIQQHRQHLLRQLNQLQNIEEQLTVPPPSDYSEDEISVDEGYQPGASYEQLMNSLPPPSSNIPTRKLADPNEYTIPENEAYLSPRGENANNANGAWEAKSMSLRSAQRPPQPPRERFATVSSGTRPAVGGLTLNSETQAEFFHPSQPTSPTGNSFASARAQPEPTRLVTAASDPAVNLRHNARRSMIATSTPVPQPPNESMKRASTYGMTRVDPDKDGYQARREVRKPTTGLPKLLLTISLIDGSNKLVVATDDFRVQDLLYAFAEQLDLKQTDFFYLSVVFDKNPHVYRWLNPQKTLREEGIQGSSYIILRIKYFKLPKKLFDPVAVSLYYLHVNYHIINGDYLASPSMLIKLAAIQFTMTHGAHKPSIHKPGFMDAEALSKYFPKYMIDANPITSLYVRLFGMHAKTPTATPIEAKLIYLDTASDIPTFGMTPFEVTDSVKDPNRAQRIFGVAEDGLFLSKKTSIDQMEFYSYDDVLSWGVRVRGFEIVVRHPTIADSYINIELEPKHPELSHTIVDLINGYCLFLAFADENKYGHLPVVNDEPLPHPSLFHPPKPRNLDPVPPSRLSLLRAFYIEKCRETKHPEIQSFLLQVDKAIDFNETLETLTVRKCGLNESQMFHFSRIVAKAPTLKGEGEIVENLNITSLDISGNQVGPEAAEAVKILVDSFPSIKILKLSNVGLAERGTGLLVPVLEKQTKLEVLDVSANNLNNTSMALILGALVPNEVLREFYSDLNMLTDKVALQFAQMAGATKTLTTLSLAKNKLGSKGLKIFLEGLSKNKTIENLDLSSNMLGNKHMKTLLAWLQGNAKVKKLKLADNKLNQQTGAEIAKVLAAKGLGLQVLDVTLNELGTKGTKEVILAMKITPTLTEIHLSGNKISDKGAKLLCESLEIGVNLQKLAIRLCSFGKGALKGIIRAVTPHRQLKFLDLALNEISHGIAVVLGAMLAQNSILEVLHLSNCSLGARELTPIIDALPRNTKLKKLYLDVNKLSKSTLLALAQAICANEHLEKLSLKNIETTTKDIDEFFKALVRAKALKRIDMGLNGLQESYFASSLKRLTISVKF